MAEYSILSAGLTMPIVIGAVVIVAAVVYFVVKSKNKKK